MERDYGLRGEETSVPQKVVEFLTGMSIGEIGQNAMFPNEFHLPFNFTVLIIEVFCFAIKTYLALYRQRSVPRTLAWIHTARKLDRWMGALFGLYLVCHLLVYLAELRYTSLWSFSPANASHHFFAMVGFFATLYELRGIWADFGVFQVLPYVLHSIYWTVLGTNTMLFVYNVALVFAIFELYRRSKRSRIMCTVFFLVANCNYWVYCDYHGDNFNGLFCPGQLVSVRNIDNEGHSVAGPDYSPILSGLLFFVVFSGPMLVHMCRSAFVLSSSKTLRS